MELYDLQNEINKLYDKNYKLKTVDYNYLLHNTTKFKEMEATVFIYDHMIFNNVKPDSDTYDLINRLHSKTIYENNKIYIKKSLKKKLKPRRRIHKIMKGYNYSENYQEALIHLDIVKKFALSETHYNATISLLILLYCILYIYLKLHFLFVFVTLLLKN